MGLDKELGKLQLEMEEHRLLEVDLELLKQLATVKHLVKVLEVDRLELDKQEVHQEVYRQEIVNQVAKSHVQLANVSRLYQD